MPREKMKRTIIGAAQQLLKTTCVASTTVDKWLPTQRRTVVAEDLGARKLLGCRLPVAMDASAEMPKVGDWRLAAAFDSGTKFRRLLWTLAQIERSQKRQTSYQRLLTCRDGEMLVTSSQYERLKSHKLKWLSTISY